MRRYSIDTYDDGSVLVKLPHGANFVDLDRPEDAEKFAEALRAAADEARDRRDGPYVQVRFLGGTYSSGLYTYRDPSRRCDIGDVVEVPVGTSNKIKLAKVEKFGRGRAVKHAQIEKCVQSILQREVL